MTNKKSHKSSMSIKLANPRGFCAGVDRAIDIVDRALDILVRLFMSGMRLCIINLWWINSRGRGAIFVDELSDIPSRDGKGKIL